MKKSLLALAILASATTAAQAATSVTLYGRVDVGYENWTGDGASLVQSGNTDSRLGVKGSEDLGNGLAATFQLEGRFNADTGSYPGDMFNRESTVGLKGNFGHVRFGRSKAAMERALGDYNPGERVTTIWDNYNSDDFYGLGGTSTRNSNSAFYDYDMGGLNVGANVTTKGGATNTTVEGDSGNKVGYGVHASYAGDINNSMSYSVAAAFQKDGSTSSDLTGKGREWGVGAQLNFKPVSVGGSYADYRNSATSYKARTWGAYVTANITANDAVYAKYMSKRTQIASVTQDKLDMFGLGYSHALSKRTSVYADVGRYRDRVADTHSTGYNVAMRHAF